jgi:hypothetical protein
MLDTVVDCGKLIVSGQGYQRVAFIKTQSARPYLSTTEESKRFGTCAQHRVTRFSLAGKLLTHGVGRKSFKRTVAEGARWHLV